MCVVIVNEVCVYILNCKCVCVFIVNVCVASLLQTLLACYLLFFAVLSTAVPPMQARAHDQGGGTMQHLSSATNAISMATAQGHLTT